MCTHTFTPLLSYFCGSQLPDSVTLHWKLPPLPASLSFQMSYVRHPALRDKDRHSISKWDLATSKLSSDSCRKGAWGGSTVQWQGRREIPPAFMITVKIDVQWVYENLSFLSFFAFVLLGGWNIPQRTCQKIGSSGFTWMQLLYWMMISHQWWLPPACPHPSTLYYTL